MEAWGRMVNASQKESDEIANDLLNYCRLDSNAMVEIIRFLARRVNFMAARACSYNPVPNSRQRSSSNSKCHVDR